MPNLFLDKDLNEFIQANTMSEEEFLAAQAALEAEGRTEAAPDGAAREAAR